MGAGVQLRHLFLLVVDHALEIVARERFDRQLVGYASYFSLTIVFTWPLQLYSGLTGRGEW